MLIAWKITVVNSLTSIVLSAPPAESVLYLHSIYDQYLPILVPPPPTDGVTEWANDYYKRKVEYKVWTKSEPKKIQQANEEYQQAQLGSAEITPADASFAAKLLENAPKILHLGIFVLVYSILTYFCVILALFNLAHPAALARLRSFELIHRLGPSGFARSPTEDDSLRLQLFPFKVVHYPYCPVALNDWH